MADKCLGVVRVILDEKLQKGKYSGVEGRIYLLVTLFQYLQQFGVDIFGFEV